VRNRGRKAPASGGRHGVNEMGASMDSQVFTSMVLKSSGTSCEHISSTADGHLSHGLLNPGPRPWAAIDGRSEMLHRNGVVDDIAGASGISEGSVCIEEGRAQALCHKHGHKCDPHCS
jgi:hypothetical protein